MQAHFYAPAAGGLPQRREGRFRFLLALAAHIGRELRHGSGGRQLIHLAVMAEVDTGIIDGTDAFPSATGGQRGGRVAQGAGGGSQTADHASTLASRISRRPQVMTMMSCCLLLEILFHMMSSGGMS